MADRSSPASPTPIPDDTTLPERDWTYALRRLSWLDAEITRYRDFEWKATSFHAAVFVALIYAALDGTRRATLLEHSTPLKWVVAFYLGFAIVQLFYIHQRLNRQRLARDAVLRLLNQPSAAGVMRFYDLCEGPGVLFVFGFALSLFGLAWFALVLLGSGLLFLLGVASLVGFVWFVFVLLRA